MSAVGGRQTADEPAKGKENSAGELDDEDEDDDYYYYLGIGLAEDEMEAWKRLVVDGKIALFISFVLAIVLASSIEK